MKKFFFTAIFLILFLPAFSVGEESPRRLMVFESASCHKCIKANAEIIPGIKKEFSGRIIFESRDISDIENYKLLLGLHEKYKSKIKLEMPVFFFEGRFVNGTGDLKNNLKNLIEQTLSGKKFNGAIPQVDLIARFKSFKPVAIVSAGLVDGINPCAFTVIVFFISFLALQGYRKRELIAIGMTFIFAVFLTYLALGLGIFNFLYSIRGFWLAIKLLNWSIGLMCVVLGFVALYDFYKFKTTGLTDELKLQLPKSVKDQIHSVIGLHYRKHKDSQEAPQKAHILKLLLSALVTGFLVSLLEAVCTGQLYVPTITFVLKSTQLKFHAFLYLVLYNIMFVVPLFMIFLFALLGVTSGQFANFLKKNLLTIKILMAVVFFGLGIFLIWRA